MSDEPTLEECERNADEKREIFLHSALHELIRMQATARSIDETLVIMAREVESARHVENGTPTGIDALHALECLRGAFILAVNNVDRLLVNREKPHAPTTDIARACAQYAYAAGRALGTANRLQFDDATGQPTNVQSAESLQRAPHQPG